MTITDDQTPDEVPTSMDEVELNHWKYRVIALTRQVEFIHDTVNMASAYRNPKTANELQNLQYQLDCNVWLLYEAKHKVFAETGVMP